MHGPHFFDHPVNAGCEAQMDQLNVYVHIELMDSFSTSSPAVVENDLYGTDWHISTTCKHSVSTTGSCQQSLNVLKSWPLCDWWK